MKYFIIILDFLLKRLLSNKIGRTTLISTSALLDELKGSLEKLYTDPLAQKYTKHLFVSCRITVSGLTLLHGISLYLKTFKPLHERNYVRSALDHWSSSTLNHLVIIIGKHFLYCIALNNIQFLFGDFISIVFIAVLSNKCRTFGEKWSNFMN